MQQQKVTVKLTVKARDAAHAEDIVRRKLQLTEWLCEDAAMTMEELVQQGGFPEGSLLYYTVHAEVTPSEPIPQIQC